MTAYTGFATLPIGGESSILKVSVGPGCNICAPLGWQNLDLFALPHNDRDDFYASVHTSRRYCELQKAHGGGNPLLWLYLSGWYCQCSELKRTMVARIKDI